MKGRWRVTLTILVLGLGLLWAIGAMARGPMSAKAQSAFLGSIQEAAPDVRTDSKQGTSIGSNRGQQSSGQALNVLLMGGRASFRR